LIAGTLLYWAYVAFSGTGYEAATWRHFINKWKGISLELGPADRSPPDNLGNPHVTTSNVKIGDLIAVPFSEGDRDFYLIISKSTEGLRIFHQPMSDYRETASLSATKIWLMKIPELPPGQYVIFGATTRNENTKPQDLLTKTPLPTSFSYTSPRLISVSN
jgi:hypothetical protein